MVDRSVNQVPGSYFRNVGTDQEKSQIDSWMMLLALAATTAITGSFLQKSDPQILAVLKVAAYLIILVLTLVLIRPAARSPRRSLRKFHLTYRKTVLFPLIIYFTGLLIGALAGPAPFSSLWQMASDGLVVLFAFAAFGWLCRDLGRAVQDFLKIIAVLSLVLLVPSLIIYIGNLQGWWLINPFYFTINELFMNGPFNHANHLGYVLMTGMLAAAVLAATRGALRDNLVWVGLSIILGLGLVITQARGAYLGGAVGMVGLAAVYWRKWAGLILGLTGVFVFLGLTFQVLWDPGQAHFVPGVLRVPNSAITNDPPTSDVAPSDGALILNPGDQKKVIVDLEPGQYRLMISGQLINVAPNRNEDFSSLEGLGVSYRTSSSAQSESVIQFKDVPGYLFSEPIEQAISGELELSFKSVLSTGLSPESAGQLLLKSLYLVPEGWIADSFEIYDLLPKAGISGRFWIWGAGLANLAEYGPLGVGSGQTESVPGLSMHNILLEQYGEGGILTTVGFLGWLLLPVLSIRQSRLESKLAWGVVAMMAALMVHGIFWTQFLNGVRYLTLVYVGLWTALATIDIPGEDEASHG